MIKFSETENELRHPAALTHQGKVIAFAIDQSGQIFYRVLDLDPTQKDDDEGWRDRKLLKYPREIRPAGMSVITVEDRMFKGEIKDAPPFQNVSQPFQVLSTGQYIYLFRQSPHNTIYVNRYVFDPGPLELNLSWEPRFQRSRKRDLPANPKDTLGTRDMEDEPFEEPTLDLHFVRDVKEGRFVVLRLPTAQPDVFRWQIFTTHENDPSIHQYSIKQSADGLFDLNPGIVHTNFKVSLFVPESDLPEEYQVPLAGPGAILYALQENSLDSYGREQKLKREQRVLLAFPLDTDVSNVMNMGFLDFGLSPDGTLPDIVKKNSIQLEYADNGADSPIEFSLPLLTTDPYSSMQPLTYGGLLTLDRAQSAPVFLDSADGLIHMYYSGSLKHGQNFYSLHFNTLTARAEFELTARIESPTSSGLRFVALRSGTLMNDLEIIFDNGKTEDTCQLKFSIEDVTETWSDLPRSLQDMATILNGQAAHSKADPDYINGSIPFYDYENNLKRQGLTGDFVKPSLLVRTYPVKLSDDAESSQIELTNKSKAERSADGIDPLWLPEPENNAIQISDQGVIQIDSGLDLQPGSITAEAWVKPKSDGVYFPRRLIHYHDKDSFELYLGLKESGVVGGIQFYAATRQIAGQTGKAIQTRFLGLEDSWNHIAAVYRAGSALQLDGYSYANCGNDTSLRGLAKSTTVEAWVVPDEDSLAGIRPILSKWGPKTDDQSWMLCLENGVPTFKVRWQHENEDATKSQNFEIKGNATLLKDEPAHIAAVFDFEPREQEALDFSGNGKAQVEYSNSLFRRIKSDYTYELWLYIKDTELPAWKRILEDHIAEGPSYISSTEPESGDPNVKIEFGRLVGSGGDGAIGFSQTLLGLNEWHHVALVKQGHKLSLFIDGLPDVEIDDMLWEQAEITDRQYQLLNIGSTDLMINDIRIWDHARTPEQILTNMDNRELSSENGLLLYLPMGKGSAPSDQMTDRSGNNNNLKLLEGLKTTPVDKCTYQVHLQVGEKRISRPVETDSEKRKEVMLRESASEVLIGSAHGFSSYRGLIDEVRIWQVQRHENQIAYYQDRPLSEGSVGLVSEWRFEETPGARSALDSKSENHARLIHSDKEKVEKMLVPTELRAGWRVYVNGEEVHTDHSDFFNEDRWLQVGYPFTIGGIRKDKITESGEYRYPFRGDMDEIRIWRAQRTAEQVRDYMYRRLTGMEDELWGYWAFDASEEMYEDYSGNGRGGNPKGEVLIVPGGPISNERPEIRYALLPANVDDNKWALIIDRPAVAEYGDMQFDADGNMIGVMKRCYLYNKRLPSGHDLPPIESPETDDLLIRLSRTELTMASGFAIGNLDLQFITQVQTAPTLIGYIEGAPPVPSENLTVNTDEQGTDTYAASSSLELVESQSRTQIFSATQDAGDTDSKDIKFGLEFGVETEIGLGVSETAFKAEQKIGGHRVVSQSNGLLNESTLSSQTTQNRRSKLSLSGTWEQPDEKGKYLNPVINQRYIPNNVGYALVKSGTADLFGLRLRQTGSLVAYNLMPNPDIPVDWNIIMFPINPKYTKNGTLDGMVGTFEDLDYKGASQGKRGSYFKPIEAYALKAKIRRQEKQIASYYDTFDIQNNEQANPATENKKSFLETNFEGVYNRQGYDWEADTARRSLVNTYVWTAEGGLYAEEEQFANVRQESLGGNFQSTEQWGGFGESSIEIFGVGFFYESELLSGSYLNLTKMKTEESQAVFNLNVNVNGEGFLNHLDAKTNKYTSELSPGKVTGYRFMTFYLAPDNDNFDAFFTGRNPVVDPDWLDGSSGKFDPDALALKAAMTRPNKVWRVMHRTTYVSRVPEEIGNPPEELKSPQDPIPENVDGNWDVIEMVKAQTPSLTKSDGSLNLVALGEAVDAIIESKLSEVLPWWQAVPEEKDQRKIKRAFRDDLMTYTKNYFTVYPFRIESGVQSTAKPEIATRMNAFESSVLTATEDLDAIVSTNRYVGLLNHSVRLTEAEPVMPGSPNPVRFQWQQIEGPGIVEFSPNARLLNPFVRFSKPGHYRLLMTAFVDHYQTMRLINVEVLDETPYILITKDRLKLRQGPSTNYTEITVLDAQEKIKLLARNTDSSWWYIRNGNLTGWVSARWTTKPRNLKLDQVPVLDS